VHSTGILAKKDTEDKTLDMSRKHQSHPGLPSRTMWLHKNIRTQPTLKIDSREYLCIGLSGKSSTYKYMEPPPRNSCTIYGVCTPVPPTEFFIHAEMNENTNAVANQLHHRPRLTNVLQLSLEWGFFWRFGLWRNTCKMSPLTILPVNKG